MAPSKPCSASMLCGGVRNLGSAGACLRAVESNGGMVPINRFACGRFAVGRNCLSEFADTQHLCSLDDAKLPDAKPFLQIAPESGEGKAYCHASAVDNPAAPRWEIIILGFPVTHRDRSEDARMSALALDGQLL